MDQRQQEQSYSLVRRLWIYQSERIPLAKTSVLLAVFSAASINVSAMFAGRPFPSWTAYGLAFIVALVVFIQLRACDEYKDGPDDFKYRPERPIPRGLVTLKTILTIGFALVPVAAILTFLHFPTLLILLLGIWLWMGMMTAEFFVPEWLKARPVLYMVSHMMIMPLLDLFITGVEWLPASGSPEAALTLFLALSFLNGCILEIGRKIWTPENEIEGVETYSGLWGLRASVTLWLIAIAIAFLLLCGVGLSTGHFWVTVVPGLFMLLICLRSGLVMRNAPNAQRQGMMDTVSGLWVFICYFAAGILPVLAGYLL